MNLFWKLVRKALTLPPQLVARLLRLFPYFRFVNETADAKSPITVGQWFVQEIIGINRGPYWPVHHSSKVTSWKNVLIGVDTAPGIMPGCYIQAIGKVRIGSYTRIGPNVSIISANHDLLDNRRHQPDEVNIGDYCWLAANSVVLPGVTLGDFTIVGAGAIVTKSFPEGHCVLVGNPARKVKTLNPDECVRYTNKHEYIGFIHKSKFEDYRKKTLNC